MKKIVSLFIILVLSLSIVACNKNKNSGTDQTPDTIVITVTPVATAVPDSTATPVPTATPDPTAAPISEPTEAPTPELTAESTPEPTEISEAEELSIEVTTVKVDREDFTEADLAVSYDTVRVLNFGYEALKESLEEIINSRSTSIEAFAEGYLPDMVYVSDDLSCFIENSIDLYRVDDDVVSLSTTEEAYLGGAHPSCYINSYNFDTKTGEQISILDLFGKSVYSDEWYGFRTALYYELANYEDADSFFYDYKETVDNILSEDNVDFELVWFYGEDSITVVFNQYVIAPYAAGIISVSIPFENGEITYPEVTDEELLSELNREWNIFYSEVEGGGEVYGFYSDSNWEATDIATFTVNSDGTATFMREGEVVFENSAITFGSWKDTYFADPYTSSFNIDYTDGTNSFYGTYDGENVYLIQEIESEDYHVAVYMVFVPGEPIYHEAYASVLYADDSNAIISLKEFTTLLSWDDPEDLAAFGVTENDFINDYLLYTYPQPAYTITIDSWYPHVLMNLDYEDIRLYSASYDEFIRNLNDKAYWNDCLGVTVKYVNGKYGPVYIAETYME